MGVVQTYVVDPLVEKAKEEIYAWITAALEVAREVTLDISYSVALFGGGVLALVSGITGSRSAKKWFLLIQLVNILIQYLLR